MRISVTASCLYINVIYNYDNITQYHQHKDAEMSNALLINFKQNASTLGARRETLKAIADKLGVSETKAAHIAINRLYNSLFPTVEGTPSKEAVDACNAAYAQESIMEQHFKEVPDTSGFEKIENSIVFAFITNERDRLKIQQAPTEEAKRAEVRRIFERDYQETKNQQPATQPL